MLARRTTPYLRILSTLGAPQQGSLHVPSLSIFPRPYPRGEHTRSIFDTARSFFGEPQAPPPPFPVVVLSGFLGVGKTTVLEQLLRDHHGFKLGVVVNDLASVNVDANLLRDAIKTAGAQSVSLENGCVCCTAADDLQESVLNLLRGAGATPLDAIVVELSGVAEPARVKEMLEAPTQPSWFGKSEKLSVRTVTVVDCPAFATDYLREQSAHHEHAHSASGECDARYGSLLAEQVESADLLLLNKADVATQDEIMQTQAMVAALNETATMRTTEYGKIQVHEFLGAEPKVVTEAHKSENNSEEDTVKAVKSCCAAKTCSSTNKESTKDCETKVQSGKTPSRAETRFGITSFVYSTERLMSRAKLVRKLSEWQTTRDGLGNKLDIQGLTHESSSSPASSPQVGAEGAAVGSPLAPILRSKGMLLLDTDPDVAFFWSHAGKAVNFSVLGPWPENTAAQAQGGFGARRTELVFIGAGYEETSIRHLLDSCLLADHELNQSVEPEASASH